MERCSIRIPILLDLIEMYWIKEENCQLRFGQVVELLKLELNIDDLFNIEDDIIVERLCNIVNCDES